MPLDKHMLRACFPFLLRLKFLVLLGKLACELTSLPHLTNTEIKTILTEHALQLKQMVGIKDVVQLSLELLLIHEMYHLELGDSCSNHGSIK